MVVLVEGAYLGKHDAEESQFGGTPKKIRWESAPESEDDDKQAQELLAWELEQEQWTEKSDAAILEDPQWQRVGIGRAQSTSPYSDDERELPSSGHHSPIVPAQSQTFADTARLQMTPTRSFSQPDSEPFFLVDQRLVQQPMSPTLNNRSIQQPIPRGQHQIEPLLSPSYRPPSPSPSVRSSSSVVSRYNGPDPHYLYSPKQQNMSSPMHGTARSYDAPPHYKVFGQETLGMRMKSFSPSESNRYGSPMADAYEYGGPSGDQLITAGGKLYADYNPSQYQTPTRSASWNSYAAMSPQNEADQLEAEFARLENGRGQDLGFPGVPSLDERDERNARRSNQEQKAGYDLEELEEEFERLESRNQETISLAKGEVSLLEEDPSDGVIHLEDHGSLDDDDDISGAKNPNRGVGITDLQAEIDDAMRRKEALLRTCSIDSNEDDDILGETSTEKASRARMIPTRKSRWQEKLERFERKGLADAEANLDISKYPRLQQIRQRRKERLKALMSIRQERAEIWSTLEANWEQMENSMTRRLATDQLGKVRRKDPEPTTPRRDTSSDLELIDETAKDEEGNSDSLEISASETSAKGEIENPNMREEAVVPEGKVTEKPAARSRDITATVANSDPIVSVTDLVEDLVEDFMARNSIEDRDSQAVSVIEKKPHTGEDTGPPSGKGEAIPASTVTLLENMTGTKSDKETEDKVNESTSAMEDKHAQKEDPPSSFGAYISQSMSDVGNKVVGMLKSVRSNDGQPQAVTSQGTDTHEEEASQVEKAATEDGGVDGDDEVSHIVGNASPRFEDEEAYIEHQGCVNPLQDFLGNHRRRVVEDVADGGGCINPLAHLSFGKASHLFGPIKVGFKGRQRQVPGYVDEVPSVCSDLQNDRNQEVNARKTHVEEAKNLDSDNVAIRAQGEGRRASTHKKTPTSRALTSKKAKRSKKARQKKPDGGVDTFFTLVDDLLVNNILHIVDEKVVDNMAHTFGFD